MPSHASDMPVGAGPAPPQQDVVGVPPVPDRISGSSGAEGAIPARGGGHGCPDSQGPALYRPPVDHGLARPSTSKGLQRDVGAGPSTDAFRDQDDDVGGAEDADMESAFDEDGEDDPSSASSASDPPDAALVARWESFCPLQATKSSFSSARRRMKKWSGGVGSAFSFPRQDLCLHTPFASFKKFSKALWDSASSHAASSGAAGHAVVTSSARIDVLKSHVEGLITDDASEAYWRPFVDGLAQCLAPLDDASSILASSFARDVAVVRKGVVAAAPEDVRSFLADQPPSGGYFFGNPTQELQSAMSISIMQTQLSQTSASRRPHPARRPPARYVDENTLASPPLPKRDWKCCSLNI